MKKLAPASRVANVRFTSVQKLAQLRLRNRLGASIYQEPR